MVQSRRLTPDTLRNPYALTEALSTLAHQLPFSELAIEELTSGLLANADAQLKPETGTPSSPFIGATQTLPDFEELLLKYLERLPKSVAFPFITTPKDLYEDFIFEITQPLRMAEQDAMTFEGHVVMTLSRHPVMMLTTATYDEDPAAALTTLANYEHVLDRLLVELRALHTYVRSELEVTYRDPERICLKIRNILHTISNILTVQSGAVQGITTSTNNPRERAQWIESLHAGINERLNPFHYIQKTYPKVHVTLPRKNYAIPHPGVVRQILQHFVRNALDAGAERISLSLIPPSSLNAMLAIAVLDDGPGIPPEHLPLLGRTKIVHNNRPDGGYGLYLVRHELVPQLGHDADFTIESPISGGRGTLAKLMLPLAAGSTTPDPAPRRGTTERIAPVEPASSMEKFGVPVGLAPAMEAQPALDDGMGFTRTYDMATAGGFSYMGARTTVALPLYFSGSRARSLL